MIFEICIDNVEAAKTAEREGAHRVELCANLFAGGTTPSYGMIKKVRETIDIDLFVMIRPREGDFNYTDEEFEIMKTDINTAKELGADGVVFGILDKNYQVDFERVNELVEISKPMEITFHRAFDHCFDPVKTFSRLKEIGISRVLTSGQKEKAIDGAALISELNALANEKIKILAGSGINSSNVKTLVEKTGVEEIHFTCHKKGPGLNPDNISMGAGEESLFGLKIFDVEKFRNINSALK